MLRYDSSVIDNVNLIVISYFSYGCDVLGRHKLCHTLLFPWMQGLGFQLIFHATVLALALVISFPVSISSFPIMQGSPPEPPLELNELKYDQRGLRDLRQHLGVLPHVLEQTHGPSFDTADIAWIATSLSLASSTDLFDHAQFPPEFSTLREGMPKGKPGSMERASMRSRLQKLLFDLVSDVWLIFILLFIYILRLLSWIELTVVQLS